MWRHLAVLCAAAVAIALPAASALAIDNPDPVGRGVLAASNGSGISGTVFVRRQLSRNETDVALRLAGLASGAQVFWDLQDGTYCGGPVMPQLIKHVGPLTASSAGTLLNMTQHSRTLAVGAPLHMTVRVYESRHGAPGNELACGKVAGLPEIPSIHWW